MSSQPDAHYTALLHEMQTKEVEADHRDARIDEQTKYSMEKGNEFYPFEESNLREAMAEILATDDGVLTLVVVMEMKQDTSPVASELIQFGLGKLARKVQQYWEPIARKDAEKVVV